MQQTFDRGGELRRIVGDQDLAAIPNTEALGAHGGGHGRRAHHQCLDDLSLGAGAIAERDHRDPGAVQVGDNRGDPADDLHIGEPCGQVPHVLLRVGPHDRDLVFGEQRWIEARHYLLA